MAAVNLSGKSAISFWTKGDSRTYQLMLFSKSKGPLPLTKRFTAGSAWKQVTISLEELGTDGSDLEGIKDVTLWGIFFWRMSGGSGGGVRTSRAPGRDGRHLHRLLRGHTDVG
jgi:hypothetical protein